MRVSAKSIQVVFGSHGSITIAACPEALHYFKRRSLDREERFTGPIHLFQIFMGIGFEMLVGQV